MICAIPLGGYVKMAGEERAQCKGSPEEFFSKPIWQRAVIVLMGPVTNFIFAFVCFYVIFVTGFPMTTPTVGKVLDGYPAKAAGLLPGDRVVTLDGIAIKGFEDIQDRVQKSSGAVLRFEIQRSGQHLIKEIVPQRKVTKNIFGKTESISIVGIRPAEDFVFVRFGPVVSIQKSYEQIYRITTMTLHALYSVITGSMPAKDVLSGPIGIFDAVKQAAAMGVSYLFLITAVISTSLAIFNLFPVPVLDGGHLFFMAIEAVRRKPLPVKWEEGLTRAGFSALICLMVFVFYNDMVRADWFGKAANLLGRLKP